MANLSERIAALEGELPDMVSFESDSTIHELIAMCRDQQAALAEMLVHWDEADCTIPRESNAIAQARAVLAKWMIE